MKVSFRFDDKAIYTCFLLFTAVPFIVLLFFVENLWLHFLFTIIVGCMVWLAIYMSRIGIYFDFEKEIVYTKGKFFASFPFKKFDLKDIKQIKLIEHKKQKSIKCLFFDFPGLNSKYVYRNGKTFNINFIHKNGKIYTIYYGMLLRTFSSRRVEKQKGKILNAITLFEGKYIKKLDRRNYQSKK